MPEPDTETIQPILDMLPTIGFSLLLLLGIALALFGRLLVRAACVVSGLVLGALGALAIGQTLGEQDAVLIGIAIAGSIIGGLLAALLFRLWVGLSSAVLLALAVPVAVIIWQGTPINAIPEDAELQESAPTHEEEQAARDLLDQFSLGQLEELLETGRHDQLENNLDRQFLDDVDIERVVEAATEAAHNWYELQLERVQLWWDAQHPESRRLIYFATLVGAGLGLALGLVLPYLMASFESALAGAILLGFSAREIALRHAPTLVDYGPQTPRGILIVLVVITILAFLTQMFLFRTGRRRRND